MDNATSPVSTQENVDPHTLAKPKKPPPVTPRRFRKFFTPRSTQQDLSSVRTSRRALQDITKPALNRKNERRTPPLTEDVDTHEVHQMYGSKRRKLSMSSAEPTLQSSPLKRVTFIPSSSQENGLEVMPKGVPDCGEDPEELQPKIQIKTYKNFGTSAAILASRIQSRGRRPNFHVGYETETANFLSSSEDAQFCDSNGAGSSYTIPFCTASCNTNSLIAIGDEEGGVRLIDSAKEDKVGFSKAFLSLRPHDNALMDLSFSSDDTLLATASGDQTGLIIDMRTQKSIACLAGHESSIKQVRFQPGSNDKVLATCGRDGSIFIWDLRCHGSDPSVNLLRKAHSHHPDHDTLRYPSTINKIQHAHRFPLAAQNTSSSSIATASISAAKQHRHQHQASGEISVTSLTFLPPSRSHLFLTASSSTSHIKLWDLRTTYTTRRSGNAGLPPAPLSTTHLPPSHHSFRGRNYGLTSLVLNSNGSHIYAACRDHAIYAYNTSHLALGSAAELSPVTNTTSTSRSQSRRLGGDSANTGLGPIFALRHPRLSISSFYIKLSLRRPSAANSYASELLAVGSSDNSAILFPTSPDYLVPKYRRNGNRNGTADAEALPTYTHGTPLIEGHQKEVTSVSWTYDGDLVSVGDDFLGRCWREDGRRARDLRTKGIGEGAGRWMCGWADVREGWDDEDG